MNPLVLVARLTLAGVFAVAGLSKLADRAGFRDAMRNFGVPGSLAAPVGIVLPVSELAVSGALVSRGAWHGAAGALALLLLFIAAIGYNLARGRHPDCRCFGQLQSRPVGASTLVRNAVLASIAATILWPGRAVAHQSLVERLGHLTSSQLYFLTATLLAVLAVAGLAWFLGKMLAQQGRILIRLDALEGRLNQIPPRSRSGGVAASGTPAPQGLPIGAPAPAFRLADLTGKETGLAELLAARLPVVLVFMDPHCGPCNALVPDLGRWSREHAGRMTIAVVSRGKAKDNQAKYRDAGLEHVLLQEKDEVADRYLAHGTPSAVLLRPDGRIGSFVRQGAEMIKGLLENVPDGRSGENGVARLLGAGQEAGMGHLAPEIRLPDLDGQMQELNPVRAKETVVLFWNPGCGFCQRMRDDLKKWEASEAAGKPELLVVSTGTSESNRAEGFTSRVVLDSGFATASKFGAGGTPSAVLVDGQARIASPVAAGPEAVMSLIAPLEVSLPHVNAS